MNWKSPYVEHRMSSICLLICLTKSSIHHLEKKEKNNDNKHSKRGRERNEYILFSFLIWIKKIFSSDLDFECNEYEYKTTYLANL